MAYVRIAQKNKSVTCSVLHVVFNLLYERSWQGGVFQFMENDYFLVFLVVWVFFSRFLGMLKSSLR